MARRRISSFRPGALILAFLIASFLFYSYIDWRLPLLLIISGLTGYLASKEIGKSSSSTRQKTFLILSIAVNLGMLICFKHLGFYSGEFPGLRELAGTQSGYLILSLIIPIGLSFYTLQVISYTVDVYRKQFEAEKDIVAFFGEQILNKDRSLDRAKLREIVFKDLEKKKKLESFQHPRIFEAFFELVEQYAKQDPNVIIQAVVPLLIEVNMQSYFHHVIMVYASEEEQKKRLMQRDSASEELALSMIRSQLSVNEKKGYCDLVVNNSGSLDETRRQVEELWQKLKKMQKERKL